jgi:hypothetical protein
MESSLSGNRKGYIVTDSEGFKYRRDMTRGERSGWRCCKNFKTKCKARIVTIGQEIVKRSGGFHNHPPDVLPLGDDCLADQLAQSGRVLNKPRQEAVTMIEPLIEHSFE